MCLRVCVCVIRKHTFSVLRSFFVNTLHLRCFIWFVCECVDFFSVSLIFCVIVCGELNAIEARIRLRSRGFLCAFPCLSGHQKAYAIWCRLCICAGWLAAFLNSQRSTRCVENGCGKTVIVFNSTEVIFFSAVARFRISYSVVVRIHFSFLFLCFFCSLKTLVLNAWRISFSFHIIFFPVHLFSLFLISICLAILGCQYCQCEYKIRQQLTLSQRLKHRTLQKQTPIEYFCVKIC